MRQERREDSKPYEQKGRRKRGGKGRRGEKSNEDDSRKSTTATDLDAELDAYVSPPLLIAVHELTSEREQIRNG